MTNFQKINQKFPSKYFKLSKPFLDLFQVKLLYLNWYSYYEQISKGFRWGTHLNIPLFSSVLLTVCESQAKNSKTVSYDFIFGIIIACDVGVSKIDKSGMMM